jgi:hypothetical protein
MNSEKIFINVNKGVKLQDEDLVKGLLITKIPLDNQLLLYYNMRENEINELRTNIGRQWDEMSRWTFRDDIRCFYKMIDDEKNLKWLIELSYPLPNSEEANPIFNYLDNIHRTAKIPATDIFQTIRNTMFTLNDWYNEPEVHNLLGFYLHARNSKGLKSVWKDLSVISTKLEIRKKLKEYVKSLLPINEEGVLKDLNYKDSRSELFNLFLMLDIAKFLPIENRQPIPYNFEMILTEDWSIEHIFPQNLGDFNKLLSLNEYDLKLIKEILPKKVNQIIIDDPDKKESILLLFTKIQRSNKECQIENSERELLNFLLEKNAGDLHTIGNLALLTRGMNSGLSNNFFDEKRKIVVNKVSNGNFVPYHTYDVFSKLIIDCDTSLHVWSKTDINKHEDYIISQIKKINEYLTSEI